MESVRFNDDRGAPLSADYSLEKGLFERQLVEIANDRQGGWSWRKVSRSTTGSGVADEDQYEDCEARKKQFTGP